jgi:hypothetical protein
MTTPQFVAVLVVFANTCTNPLLTASVQSSHVGEASYPLLHTSTLNVAVEGILRVITSMMREGMVLDTHGAEFRIVKLSTSFVNV